MLEFVRADDVCEAVKGFPWRGLEPYLDYSMAEGREAIGLILPAKLRNQFGFHCLTAEILNSEFSVDAIDSVAGERHRRVSAFELALLCSLAVAKFPNKPICAALGDECMKRAEEERQLAEAHTLLSAFMFRAPLE